jgi:hypothetical protein
VTTLGEFSPVGGLFTLVSFVKMKEVEQIFGILLSAENVINIFLQKNG